MASPEALRRVAREQESRCRRARDAAQEQAGSIVARAWEEARTRLRQAMEEERRAPLPGDAKDNGEAAPAPSGFGPLLDMLLNEYGGTPEQWLWHTPRAQIMDLVREIPARHRAKSGAQYADPNDPRVIAGHRLVERLRALAEAKKGKTP